MFKIGALKLKSNLILAPMSGITDLPFRMLNRKFGCELGFTEMINVRSLSHKSKRTLRMLASCPGDRPLGIQLLGCEPGFISRALDVIAGRKFDILDFNAACPVRKVTQRGEGSSLLKDPAKLHKLLKLIVTGAGVPVTVKIRTGWDKAADTQGIALRCRDAGVSAVFIHGRTKAQGYSGAVDYDAIRRVKKALDIPVIASGDIFSQELIKKMFDETGCDGVLIARGALGNPWIFKGKSPSRLGETMLEHLAMCVDFHGEKVGVMVFRKFFNWYTKGLRGIRPLRERSSRIKTRSLMEELIRLAVSGPHTAA